MPPIDQVQHVFDAQALTSACHVGPITCLKFFIEPGKSILIRCPTALFCEIKNAKQDSNGNPWPRPSQLVEERLQAEAEEVPTCRRAYRKSA